jgi:hypothetical protein
MGLNSELLICKAGSLPLELHKLLAHFAQAILEMGLANYLLGLA